MHPVAYPLAAGRKARAIEYLLVYMDAEYNLSSFYPTVQPPFEDASRTATADRGFAAAATRHRPF